MKQIAPDLFMLSLGFVNAFLLVDGDDMTLIDTGFPSSAGQILDAVRSLGRKPSDLRHILVTHCHVDHAGVLAELKRSTGATTAPEPVAARLDRGSSE